MSLLACPFNLLNNHFHLLFNFLKQQKKTQNNKKNHYATEYDMLSAIGLAEMTPELVNVSNVSAIE